MSLGCTPICLESDIHFISGHGSTLHHQGTAGFGPCFHLPGQPIFGYICLTHSHMGEHLLTEALHDPSLGFTQIEYVLSLEYPSLTREMGRVVKTNLSSQSPAKQCNCEHGISVFMARPSRPRKVISQMKPGQ